MPHKNLISGKLIVLHERSFSLYYFSSETKPGRGQNKFSDKAILQRALYSVLYNVLQTSDLHAGVHRGGGGGHMVVTPFEFMRVDAT